MHFPNLKALQNKLFSQFPRIAITGYYIGKKEKHMKENTKISHEKFHRSFRQKLLRADRAELTSSGFV